VVLVKNQLAASIRNRNVDAMIFSNMRVLLVNDEPIIRKFVADLLRQIGIHQIHEAPQGRGALVDAIKLQPDLVSSDIRMEPMYGTGFVKKLRALPSPYLAHVPVKLMTADTMKQTQSEVLPLGIKGYPIKPPTLEVMRAKVRAAGN
jgi:two-component system chemotaxis response regulator CheY